MMPTDESLKAVNADLKEIEIKSTRANQLDHSDVTASFAEVKAAVEAEAKEPSPDGGMRGHVISAEERERIWWEVNLRADFWFSKKAVGANEAAMLLCGFEPSEQPVGDAPELRAPELPERALSRLLHEFNEPEHGRKSLRDWLQLASEMGMAVHPWARRYLELSSESKTTPANSTSAVSATPKARKLKAV